MALSQAYLDWEKKTKERGFQQAKFTIWVLLLRMRMRRSRTNAFSSSLNERSKVNAPEGGGSLTIFSVTNLKH